METFAGILGGLGLFFAGMWLLSENLKALAVFRLRMFAASWIPNRYAAFGWGAITGLLTQSMTSLTFITVSTRQAGFISTQQALAVILGGNVGASFLVLIAVLDIRIVALIVLGMAGVAPDSRSVSARIGTTPCVGGIPNSEPVNVP